MMLTEEKREESKRERPKTDTPGHLEPKTSTLGVNVTNTRHEHSDWPITIYQVPGTYIFFPFLSDSPHSKSASVYSVLLSATSTTVFGLGTFNQSKAKHCCNSRPRQGTRWPVYVGSARSTHTNAMRRTELRNRRWFGGTTTFVGGSRPATNIADGS